jgi:hypothetical protein
MLFWRDVFGIATPVAGKIRRDVESLEVVIELLEDRVSAGAEDKRQNTPRRGVDGIPKPSLILFVSDIAPWLVGLDIYWRINEMPNFRRDLPRTGKRVGRHHLDGLFLALK